MTLDPLARQQAPCGALRVVVCGSPGAGTRTLLARLAGQSASPGAEEPVLTAAASARFSTGRCSIGVTAIPAGERSSRQILAAAAIADAAVIVVDARTGVLAQTRRDASLLALLGIRKLVLAVNKMDLVGHAQAPFREIADRFHEIAAQSGLADAQSIPLSALTGDNMRDPAERMPRYPGPTLVGCLDTVAPDAQRRRSLGLRLPVAAVARQQADPRTISGTIAAGTVRPGDRIRVQPSGREGRIERLVGADGESALAVAGEPVTLNLADDVEVAVGDLVSAAADPAEVADQFEAAIVWLGEDAMLPGRTYELAIGTSSTDAVITAIKYRLELDPLQHLAARTLARDQVGVCNLALDRAVPFDPYRVNRETGGFTLIDRATHATVGAGMLHFALRRAHNIQPQAVDVDKAARAARKGQRAAVVWFTGLSGAGKSTIANLVEKELFALGKHTYLLDGDNVRHGLNRDLGFTAADRVENIRRVAEVARLMVDAGLIVLVAFISPFRAEREMARAMLAAGEFVEVHVDTPLAVAEQRDLKGLYRKARRGELRNFTGIDSPYEAPAEPELRIDTAACSPRAAADQVIATLRGLGVLD